MRARIGLTVFALCLVGFAVVHLLRERPHCAVPPLIPVEVDAGGAAASPGPAAAPEMPPPAPRSRGLDPMWPGAAPPPPAEDLRPAEDLADEPPGPGARPSPAAEHYLSRVLGEAPRSRAPAKAEVRS